MREGEASLEGKSRPLRILAAIIEVHPGEGRILLSLVLLFFCLTVAFICTLSASFSLFLSTYGYHELPVLYLVMAGSAVLVGGAYLRLSARLPLSRLLIVNLGFLLAGSVAVWAGLYLPEHRWLIFLLPAWYQALADLGFLAVFSLANRIFDVRQAKRLLGPVGAGYWLALIVGGFAVPPLVQWLGTENLLLVAAAGVALGLAVLLGILRGYTAEIAGPQGRPGAVTHPRSLLKLGRYVGWIIALVVCTSLGFYLVDNIMYNRAAAQFHTASQLAAFLGVLGGAQGVLGLFSTSILTSRILGRYGLRAGLMLLPVLAGILLGFLALTGSLAGAVLALFWLAAAAKVVTVALTFSLQQSSIEMLYQPLPPNDRVRTQAIAEGIVPPAILGVTGVLLLGLRLLFDTNAVHLSYLFLGLAVVWIVTAGAVVREYSRALARAIRRRAEWNPVADVTPESIPILTAELESTHPEAVLYAVDLLGDLAPDRLHDALPALVRHPAPVVREEALRRIEELRITSAAPAVRERLENEPLPAVKGLALRALAALERDGCLTTVSRYADDPHPEIVLGAIGGAFRYGGPDGVALALEKMRILASSTHATERALGAELLGDMGEAGPVEPLQALLDDTDPEVRRAALHATGEAGHETLWPSLVEALSVPAMRRTAMAALVRGGEHVLPAIETAMGGPGQDRDVLRRLARACGRIRGAGAMSVLMRNLGVRDTEVRTEVLRALRACGFVAAGHDEDAVEERVTAELIAAAGYLQSRLDLSERAELAMLVAALDEAVHRVRERLFLLLSFLYDARSIMGARDALAFGSVRNRAYALEFLGTLLPSGRREAVLPLLSGAEPGEVVRELAAIAPDEQLEPFRRMQLLSDPACAEEDPWVYICAVWSARWETGKSEGGEAMPSILERVILLKTVSIFARTPDHVLATVASVVEDEEYPPGTEIIRKGDPGDSMFVIVSGRVRVHDGDAILAELGEREVFGEMTVLHPEPRSASIMAVEETRVLRLRHDAFYEVAADQVEIIRGIVDTIADHLRAQDADVVRLTSRVNELERELPGQAVVQPG
jgi:CRP-like cAMP-binding protein/ATP/ADP translocase